MYLGIEIGGTKLQLGVGADDGRLVALWRGKVDPSRGADGIREQITAALPTLPMKEVRSVGIGFGGPVDDSTQTVLRSNQIAGWDSFPLAEWISDLIGRPSVLGNDADVAGLGESRHGAGKGFSPLFYMTIGSGIGGGLMVEGQIYRGIGRGAAEIGQILIADDSGHLQRLEMVASGWGIERRAGRPATELAEAARGGDSSALAVLDAVCADLATALTHVIALLCPRRIVIGGGVSLMGEELLFVPLRRHVTQRVFPPFAGLTDIVPAALGEEVVVHGAIAMAAQADIRRGLDGQRQ